jgi:hypothetical protein
MFTEALSGMPAAAEPELPYFHSTHLESAFAV